MPTSVVAVNLKPVLSQVDGTVFNLAAFNFITFSVLRFTDGGGCMVKGPKNEVLYLRPGQWRAA